MTMLTLADLPEAREKAAKGEIGPAEAQYLSYMSQYFGDPEGTNGPVYVGALIFALFLLGVVIVRGPMLNHAVRPLIIAGHGVEISQAEPQLQALAEKADIPVVATLLGLSTMPSDHPLFKGMVGMHGNIGPNSSWRLLRSNLLWC